MHPEATTTQCTVSLERMKTMKATKFFKSSSSGHNSLKISVALADAFWLLIICTTVLGWPLGAIYVSSRHPHSSSPNSWWSYSDSDSDCRCVGYQWVTSNSLAVWDAARTIRCWAAQPRCAHCPHPSQLCLWRQGVLLDTTLLSLSREKAKVDCKPRCHPLDHLCGYVFMFPAEFWNRAELLLWGVRRELYSLLFLEGREKAGVELWFRALGSPVYKMTHLQTEILFRNRMWGDGFFFF